MREHYDLKSRNLVMTRCHRGGSHLFSRWLICHVDHDLPSECDQKWILGHSSSSWYRSSSCCCCMLENPLWYDQENKFKIEIEIFRRPLTVLLLSSQKLQRYDPASISKLKSNAKQRNIFLSNQGEYCSHIQYSSIHTFKAIFNIICSDGSNNVRSPK